MVDEPISLREYFDAKIELLRELAATRKDAADEALRVAQAEMQRRLAELNQLRSEVTEDRSQFVRKEEYAPAHEELRRQRQADSEKAIQLASDVKTNSSDIAGMKSSLMWLTRLILGAVVLGIIAYVFQKLKP